MYCLIDIVFPETVLDWKVRRPGWTDAPTIVPQSEADRIPNVRDRRSMRALKPEPCAQLKLALVLP